jgi:hypothetical protein
VVPEAQHAVAQRFEIESSLSIVFLLIEVLAPVELDDEFSTGRAEVYDVLADGMLAAECLP